MSKKNSKNGIGTEMNSSKEFTPETPRKGKTPSGHFRYNGIIYPMISENLPEEKIWCKSCKAHSAKVIGIIEVEGTYRFVIKCPFHGSYTMEIRSFKEHFPLVFIPEALNKLLFPEGYPIQHSYCRECRGTTGKVVGESADGRKWHVECQTPGCDQNWMEDKESFKQKYIGDENQPPML